MYVNLVKKGDIAIDKEVDVDFSNNTLNILNINPVHVVGKINVEDNLISYNLHATVYLEIYDDNNLRNRNLSLNLKIDDIESLDEENLCINNKILDLNAKIWENIVVELYNNPISYSNEIVSGDGWSLTKEDDEQEVIDERLQPLLKLLNEEV